MSVFSTLTPNEQGLVPAIVQDYNTKQVLMMAYMNEESYNISVAEGRTCFYSRSRQELWRKGETSGNTQQIVSITADCDSDTLLLEVLPAGPACHTGEVSCFSQPLFSQTEITPAFSLDALYDLVLSRQQEMTANSYTTYLFTEGLDKILKKVGEESTEVVIAAKNRDPNELIYEVSDLVYHTMVLLVEQGVTPQQIRAELEGRFMK